MRKWTSPYIYGPKGHVSSEWVAPLLVSLLVSAWGGHSLEELHAASFPLLFLSHTVLESLTGGWQPTVNVSWLAEAYLVKGCEHRGSGFFPLFPDPELLAECFCLWIWTFPQRADPLENVCQWRAAASWFGCTLQLCIPNLLLSCSCNIWFLCLHLK